MCSTPVGPIRLDVGYNPYLLLGLLAVYFNAPATIYGERDDDQPGAAGAACTASARRESAFPAHPSPNVSQVLVQEPGHACPATYIPSQSTGFLQKLTFNLSIWPGVLSP